MSQTGTLGHWEASLRAASLAFPSANAVTFCSQITKVHPQGWKSSKKISVSVFCDLGNLAYTTWRKRASLWNTTWVNQETSLLLSNSWNVDTNLEKYRWNVSTNLGKYHLICSEATLIGIRKSVVSASHTRFNILCRHDWVTEQPQQLCN